MKNKTRVYRTTCPVCKAKVETCDLAADENFPFCSRRCKLVDLGRWFEGEYRITEPLEKGEQE